LQYILYYVYVNLTTNINFLIQSKAAHLLLTTTHLTINKTLDTFV